MGAAGIIAAVGIVVAVVIVAVIARRGSAASTACSATNCASPNTCSGGKCVPPTSCTSNTDCASPSTCVNGACTTVTGSCKTDADCASVGGHCDDGSCAPGCIAGGCPAGNICQPAAGGTGGQCVAAPCAAATDCEEGSSCVGGGCYTATALTCKTTAECPPGLECTSGACVAQACSASVACPAGMTCTNSTCEVNAAAGIPCGGGRCPPGAGCSGSVCGFACVDDTSCGGGLACDPATGACAPAVTAPEACPMFHSAPLANAGGVCGACRTMADCPIGRHCVGGVCTMLACQFSSDCQPGKYCVGGTCEVAGASLRACSALGLTCPADAGLDNAPSGGAPSAACEACIECGVAKPCAAGFTCTAESPDYAGYPANACVRLAAAPPASLSPAPGAPTGSNGAIVAPGCYTKDGVTLCMCVADADCAHFGFTGAFCARDPPAIGFPTNSPPGVPLASGVSAPGSAPLMYMAEMAWNGAYPEMIGGYCAAGCGVGGPPCGSGSVCDLATHTCVAATEPSATTCAAVGLAFAPATLTAGAACVTCADDFGCPIGAGGCTMIAGGPSNGPAWGVVPGGAPAPFVGGGLEFSPTVCIAGTALAGGDGIAGATCFSGDDCLPGQYCTSNLQCDVNFSSVSGTTSNNVTDFGQYATAADPVACGALGGAVLAGSLAGVACGSTNTNCVVCAASDAGSALPGAVQAGVLPSNGAANYKSVNRVPRYIPSTTNTGAELAWWDPGPGKLGQMPSSTKVFLNGIQLMCPVSNQCGTGVSCNAGSTCTNGCCVADFCNSTADCATGSVCNLTFGICQTECTSDSACGAGLACVGGACSPAGCGEAGVYCGPPTASQSNLVCNWWGGPAGSTVPACVATCATAADCPDSICGPYGVCGTACTTDAGCPAGSVCQAGQGGGVCVNAVGGGAVAFTLSVAPTGKSFAAPTAPAGPVVPLDAAPALVAALSMFGFIAGGPSHGTAVLLAAAPTVASGTSGYTALFTASAPGAAPTATTVLAWPAPAGFAFAPATWAPPAGVGYMDTSLTSMATIAGVIASGATLPAGGWVAVAPGGTADAALVRGRPPLVPQALALSTDAITATYFEPARPLTSGVKKIHAEWASHAPWWM